MESSQKTLADFIEIFHRRKGQLVMSAALILVISVTVAFAMPAIYRSTATILIEQQEIPEDLVRSTITSYADQRIQVISQRVMTRANLSGIIKKYDLYADDRKTEALETIIEMLREDIIMDTVNAEVVDPRSGRPTEATIAFTLSYDSESPALAQKVANELTNLYLNENLKSRTQMATETHAFLTDETERLSQVIAQLEQELSSFKQRHQGNLPEHAQLNMTLMDRTEQQMLELDRQVRSLEERRIYLQSELAQLDPMLGSSVTRDGERLLLDPKERLRMLRAEYIRISAIYGQKHPDVQRMNREIEALTSEVGNVADAEEYTAQLEQLNYQLLEAREKYSDDHPDVKRLQRELESTRMMVTSLESGSVNYLPEVKADNPAYIQLKAQLEAANMEVQSLKEKKLEQEKKLQLLEGKMTQAPEVERKLRTLTRDYENAWAKYREVKAKQMEAQLAETLESERKGERFTLIEPPELPEEPLKPNRLAILMLGVVFSFAGGIGTAALGENIDQTVRGRKAVESTINMIPLGGIPLIRTEEDIRRRRRKIIMLTVGSVIVVLGILLGVHYGYKPLDVLWYLVMRKLSL